MLTKPISRLDYISEERPSLRPRMTPSCISASITNQVSFENHNFKQIQINLGGLNSLAPSARHSFSMPDLRPGLGEK